MKIFQPIVILTLASTLLVACSNEDTDGTTVQLEQPMQEMNTPSPTPVETSADTTISTPVLSETQAEKATATTPITANGWGPFHIDMMFEEADRAYNLDDSAAAAEPDVCRQIRIDRENGPKGMLLMFEQDMLTRITLGEGSQIQTLNAIGVGDPLPDVMDKLGDEAVETPHKYEPAPAKYLTVWTRGDLDANGMMNDPSARGIRYEISQDGVVSAIHAGGPSIQYVEGCS